MAVALAGFFGGPDPVVTGEYRLGDVRHITASSQRAARELGWRAHIGFAEGMEEFAQSGRHLLDAQGDARREPPRPGGADGLEAAAALVGGEELVDLQRARVRRERLVGKNEVEAALLDRPVDRVREPRLADDPVRGNGQRRG